MRPIILGGANHSNNQWHLHHPWCWLKGGFHLQTSRLWSMIVRRPRPGSQQRSWLILQTLPSTTGRSLLFLSECWASQSRIRKVGSSQKPPTALRIVGKGNLQRWRCDDFEQITSQNMMIVPGGNKNCLGWFKVCKPSLILRSASGVAIVHPDWCRCDLVIGPTKYIGIKQISNAQWNETLQARVRDSLYYAWNATGRLCAGRGGRGSWRWRWW